MKRSTSVAIVTLVVLVTACSGGGGSRLTPSSQTVVPAAGYGGRTVAVTVQMPGRLGASFVLAGASQARKPQFTSPNVKGVIAVQLCAQGGESPPASTQFACGDGSIFDVVYNPATYCPNYAPNSTYSCTFQFPAAQSVGSQFELDLYDHAPVAGSGNGVGGTIPRSTISANFGSGSGTVQAWDCSNDGGACLLGAGLSVPNIAVTASGPTSAIAIAQIEGFIQNSGGFLTANNPYVASVPGSTQNVAVLNNVPVGAGTFDSQGNNVTGGTCIQDAGNEYANAFTPASNQAPGVAATGAGFDQITADTNGNSYQSDNGGVLSATNGQPPNAPASSQGAAFGTADAAAAESFEVYAGGANALLTATVTPCLTGYTSGAQPMPSSNPGAPLNFPGDLLNVAYDGTLAVPTAGQVGQSGVSPDSGGAISPYYAVIQGQPRNYVGYEFAGGTNCANNVGTCGQQVPAVGTSLSHTLNASATNQQFVFNEYLVVSPLWGEVANLAVPANCTPSIACTQPYVSSGRFTQAPGTPPFSAGSYMPIVNMQGEGSSASVYALQEILPTGGVYSASVPQGNPNNNNASGGCNGVISDINGANLPATYYPPTVGAPAGNATSLFSQTNPANLPAGAYTGGASWPFFAPTSSNPSLACIVTFTDGYSTFQVEFTNTGEFNPIPTPMPYPGPTATSGSVI